MSQVTPALDIVEISSIWSQVTPQAESIEMVQYKCLCIYLKALAKHEQTVILQLWSVEGHHSNSIKSCRGEVWPYLQAGVLVDIWDWHHKRMI